MSENDYIIQHADFYVVQAVEAVAEISQIAAMLGETSNDLPAYVTFAVFYADHQGPYDVVIGVDPAKMSDDQMEKVANAPVSVSL